MSLYAQYSALLEGVLDQLVADGALPDGLDRRNVTVEPPRVVGQYVILVPKSDADGNDLGTLLPAEVAVPFATYTGWNLRRRDVGAEAMLASLAGSYLPLPATAPQRKASGDPRPSVEERYGSFEGYRKAFLAARAALLGRRWRAQFRPHSGDGHVPTRALPSKA